MKPKHVFAALATLIISVSATACSNTSTATTTVDYNEKEYSTAQELVADSDAVIRGVVLSSSTALEYPTLSSDADPNKNPQAGLELSTSDLEELAVPNLITKVQVTQSLSGDVPAGTIISVSQIGGEKDGVEYQAAGVVPLSQYAGKHVVLVLRAHDYAPFELVSQTHGLMIEGNDGTLEAAKNEAGDSTKPLATNVAELEQIAK